MNQIRWDKNRTTRSGELRAGIWGVEQSYVFSSSAGLIILMSSAAISSATSGDFDL